MSSTTPLPVSYFDEATLSERPALMRMIKAAQGAPIIQEKEDEEEVLSGHPGDSGEEDLPTLNDVIPAPNPLQVKSLLGADVEYCARHCRGDLMRLASWLRQRHQQDLSRLKIKFSIGIGVTIPVLDVEETDNHLVFVVVDKTKGSLVELDTGARMQLSWNNKDMVDCIFFGQVCPFSGLPYEFMIFLRESDDSSSPD